MRIYVNDAKTSTTGRWPKPEEQMRDDWLREVEDAVNPSRLSLGDPALEEEIRQAVRSREVYLRQLDVDRTATGQMAVITRTPVKIGQPRIAP